MIGAIQDITERIRAVNEIEKLSLVASTTNNAVVITDKEGVIEWVNDSFVKLSGYSLDEAKGRKSNFLQGTETDVFTIRRISEKLAKDEFVSEEIINYSKSGQKYWVKLDVAPVFDNHGEVKNFISIQSDITELKEFENSITAIARELASLIDNANVPIFGIEKNGTINEWNRVAAELTGFEKMEVMGADWGRFISSTNQGVMKTMVSNALNGIPSANVELPVVTQLKKHLILLLSASPRRNSANEIVGIIFVGQNITELTDYRNNLERKVEDRTRELNAALNKEKELVQMKNQFVSIASHEFRTPLASISIASGFVKKYKAKLSAEEIDTKLSNIEKQVSHMTYLLDDILMIGKAEAGKLPVFKQQIDILSFFTNITREIEKTTGSTHTVKLQQQLETHTMVSDEKLLRNIIINLLTNAIKFSPEATHIDVSITSSSERLYIQVRDYGLGIPESDIKNLFEPFFRGGNVASIQGTGLGLSIIRKAADLLKGTITVKSEVGNGTEFQIEMPLQV
jgi:PAS domain S-box-containing protein